MMRRDKSAQPGFTLIEVLTAMAIFLIICGAAFGLLTISQQRYRTESQVLNAFQEARLAMDQMVRDINDAGYPPPNQFQTTITDTSIVAMSPFAWPAANGYYTTPCQVDVTCPTPNETDLIVETNVDPNNLDAATNKVEWIRYKLVGTTLYRAVVQKSTGADPDSATSGDQLVPYIQNVMNNASSADIARFQAYYPAMFSGGNPVRLFTYTCDGPLGSEACTDTGVDNQPKNIRGIKITLIVMAPLADAQNGAPRLVMLTGQGRRMNPTQ